MDRMTAIAGRIPVASSCSTARHPGGRRTWFFLLVLGLTASRAPAGHLALDVQPSTTLRDGQVTVSALIRNIGTETAMSVRADVLRPMRGSAGDEREFLAPGEACRTSIAIGTPPPVPGTHTVVMGVQYTDIYGHPYSCLAAVPLVTDFEPGRGSPTLTVTTTRAKPDETGLTVNVAASDHADVHGTLALCLPAEWSTPKESVEVHIPAGTSQDVTFSVKNRSALPGSTYLAIVLLDHESAGRHDSLRADVRLQVPMRHGPLPFPSETIIVAIVLLLAAFAIRQFPRNRPHPTGPPPLAVRLFPIVILAAIALFTLRHLPLRLLLLDTTTVGGDTPAHNYMASHLRNSLFGHGRIISWAPGWWCGFPLFQFYFCLPYVLTALLNQFLPFNIAIKLVSILGVLALPPAAFWSGRIARLPRPIPSLLAIGALLLLFDDSNTMWGVNLFSTLAGMTASSLSFPIMLLAVSAAWRDADEGRFRLRTTVLLVALVASHFFTTLVAAMVLLIVPLLRPTAGVLRALRVLAGQAVLTGLLMAWWLLPLYLKQEETVVFGTNWTVSLAASWPAFLSWIALPAAAALPFALRPRCRYTAIMAWMLILSLLLFYFGFDRVSDVFVNIRFWPFILYAVLALAACGLGRLLSRCRTPELAVAALLLLAFLAVSPAASKGREWATWNYEGLEKKHRYGVFEKLVLPLRGSPGRLANDLHPMNETLGSSRIFELVPHLTGKPILEGGILTSAVTSLFSYYIQAETSRTCAGFPNRMVPPSFDFERATRHLKRFNVKHFIARDARTKHALAESAEWRLIAAEQGWALYELRDHDGRYVSIPARNPVAVETEDAQEAGLEWMAAEAAFDPPFVFIKPGETTPDAFSARLDHESYRACLREPRTEAAWASDRTVGRGSISEEKVEDDRITFRTTAVGAPHVIACSYYPNWKVRGAKRIYRVSPNFMLVFPSQPEVTLYYGNTKSDVAGRLLTTAGLVGLLGLSWHAIRVRTGQRRHLVRCNCNRSV